MFEFSFPSLRLIVMPRLGSLFYHLSIARERIVRFMPVCEWRERERERERERDDDDDDDEEEEEEEEEEEQQQQQQQQQQSWEVKYDITCRHQRFASDERILLKITFGTRQKGL